jgi:hypothetical protein
MGQLIVVGVLLAAGGVALSVRRARQRRARAGADVGASSRRGRWLGPVLVAVGVALAGIALAAVVARDLERRDLPPPAFASLVERPDPSLRGTVAFIVEVKDPTATEADTTRRSACARVVSASGARSKDAYCWSIDEEALATTVWHDDGRLLVTAFDAPVGEDRVVPTWAKHVDVATGDIEDVPADEVGDGARPDPGPMTDPDGNRLVAEGRDGTAHILVQGAEGSRTLLRVEDANPDWGIASGPVWSPDFAWVLWWDGSRLLLTTVDEPSTRVLALEASGGAFAYDVPTFDITERELFDG